MTWVERATETLAGVIESSAGWAPFAAFLGGALTALNPCVLVMIPLMVGFTAGIAGRTAEMAPGTRIWPRTLRFSLLFVVGFALELTALFTLFATTARWLRGWWWEYLLAGICLVVGLNLLGLWRVPQIDAQRFTTRAAGVFGAIMLGFLFGIVSLPCTGPVLLLLIGLVPQVGAAKSGLYLFLYGLGHCLLIVIAGTSIGAATALIQSQRLQSAARRIRQAAGVLILIAGAWLLFG